MTDCFCSAISVTAFPIYENKPYYRGIDITLIVILDFILQQMPSTRPSHFGRVLYWF